MKDQGAPSWAVDEWVQLPDGITSLDVADLLGKVIYLYCFQSWCPGCHSHGFPTLQRIIERYKDDENVAVVAIQTTFEGFEANDAASALKTARRYDLEIPVGQSGGRGKPSHLMHTYGTGGTPWTLIIDTEGAVRYSEFHIDPEQAYSLIDALKVKAARP